MKLQLLLLIRIAKTDTYQYILQVFKMPNIHFSTFLNAKSQTGLLNLVLKNQYISTLCKALIYAKQQCPFQYNALSCKKLCMQQHEKRERS